MTDSLDSELIELINKLTKIQSVVGGAKAKETSSVVANDGSIDKFLDLRNLMVNKLNNLKDNLENVHNLEKSPGSNPKELIALQSKIRTDLSSLNDDWRELDILYRNEAKKKRTKFSPEEMALRSNMVSSLQLEIQTIREIQRAGYVKGYQSIFTPTMEESELFRRPNQTNMDAVKGITM